MQALSRSRWSHWLMMPIVIALLVTAIGWFQMPQLQRLENRSETASAAEIERDVEAEHIRLQLLQKTPSFGFDNVFSDWAFLSFLQYFGDDVARAKTSYRLSPDYFEIVLGRNPNFLQAYTFLSTSTSIYAAMPERTVNIAQNALSSLQPDAPPGSYYAWRQLGIDQLLFLGDPQAARQSFATAAEWARLQGNTNVADLSQQTADFLANNPDSKFAQISAWSMVLTSAPDDRTRQTAIERIQALGGQIIENPDGSFGIMPPAQD